MAEAEARLDSFLDKFEPAVAARARLYLGRMKARLPGAQVLVYDNYNALAIGFAPGERASEAVLSLAVFPRWVTLCFLSGAGLTDPEGRLKGSGKRVRHVRLLAEDSLEDPYVAALIAEAAARAEPPFDPGAEQRLIVKSVSAKQRPRRLAPAPRAG
ncbi:MAG: hypothetical protein JOZ90_05080 [Alphaproteobacteria bacterium]|nr:hypothetical protein [Alphaproteobacteria bacterium]MBV9372850.1 hypothetical protein [Alphaproteobacteria bacterium]MBV9900455.1 hypothetical protein [Alphaproteobacteria bacterium]